MNKVAAILLTIVVVIIGLIIGWQLGVFLGGNWFIPLHPYVLNAISAVFLGAVFYVLSIFLTKWFFSLVNFLNRVFKNVSLLELLLGFFALILSMLLAFLIDLATHLSSIPIVGPYLPALLAIFLAYLSLTLFVSKREEVGALFQFGAASKEKVRYKRTERRYLLDTNVIIDGRIAEMLKSGIIDGLIIIPSFVLSELQYVADSPDPIRRARGRRGLETLNRIQKESPVKIEIMEVKLAGEPVDQRLLKLAKSLQATIITNDYNLAQIARLQDLSIINLNELANALKPVVLPGEEIQVAITKEGKEPNQGVGYLDDGTMVVVEGGRHYLGQTLNTVVTSILQTSAGRMIFAKPVEEHNA
ncbi:MAG: PIN domain-containing protein [Caldiserica bacterium]|jgi:uncharacterized protein YacL|nr:PIN domain-containing protein [Caldisericota bacterium]